METTNININEEFLKPKDFIKICGITYQTFWNWVKLGKIEVKKTPTNKNLIKKSELLKLNLISKPKKEEKINIIYARVSNTKQKEDLNSQIERLTNFCISNNIKIDETFSEIASGINFNRLKFNQILKLVLENKVSKIIIEHKDRFCRFGFELFENLSKFYNFEFIISTVNPIEIESFENELITDLISIVHHFSMKLYSNRRKKIKDLVNNLKIL